MVELFISLKYIMQRKKQSLISILGIMLGITVLTVSLGVCNGLNSNTVNNILGMTSHVFIGNIGRIENYRELKTDIEALDGVKGVVPTIETQGIIKHTGDLGYYADGVRIEGYDLASAIKAIDLDKKIVQGAIDPTKMDEAFIGYEMAKTIQAKIGDTITLISVENKEIDFKLGGIFKSGFYEYDLKMVIAPLPAVQYLMMSGDCANKIDVYLVNPYEADKKAIEIRDLTEHTTKTWGDVNQNLLSALSLERTVMIVMLSLIVVIAGFVVWVTLNTLVREKTKDIGILRAMGYSKKRIVKIFMYQGFVLGIIGIILGFACAFGIMSYLKTNALALVTKIYYLSEIPIELSTKETVMIAVANLAVIFISSIFPAYRAAKMDTVEALRYE